MEIVGPILLVLFYAVLACFNCELSETWFREMYGDWFDVKILKNSRTGETQKAVLVNNFTYTLIGHWEEIPEQGDRIEIREIKD